MLENSHLFNRKSVRKALRAWHNLPGLGKHPLAQLNIVEEQLQTSNYPNTLEDRGRALRDILRHAIRMLGPPAEEPPKDEDDPKFLDNRWRMYVILTQQFINGRRPGYVASQLGIAAGPYFADQGKALDLLVDILHQQEKAIPPRLPSEDEEHFPGYALPLSVVAILLLVVVAIFYINFSDILTLTSTPCPLISTRPPIPGSESNALNVEITSPQNCSVSLPSGEHVPIEGVYSEDLTGREIWVLVYASDRNYYLQAANACLMLPAEAAGGYWKTTFFDNTVEQLDIVVTITDTGSEASQFFKDWLKSACDPGEISSIPVSELPDGLTEVDAITVKTK